MELTDLRRELARIDHDQLALIAQRQSLASEIGGAKSRAARPTRGFEQEREVVERARATATELGVPHDLAEQILLSLIRSSLTVQEQEHVAAIGGGSGKRVLISGGAGKMGRWIIG